MSTIYDTENEFALAPGKLYLCAGNVARSAMRCPENYAGPTRGGVKVKYSAKNHEITDADGNTVATLRYGERVTVTGNLARITPHMIAELIGADGENVSDTGMVRLSAGRPSLKYLTFYLVCPIDGGEEFELYLRSSAADCATFSLGTSDENGLAFTLVSENTLGGRHASISFSGAEVGA